MRIGEVPVSNPKVGDRLVVGNNGRKVARFRSRKIGLITVVGLSARTPS